MWLPRLGSNQHAFRRLMNSQVRLPFSPLSIVEKAGIEPASAACDTAVLPLDDNPWHARRESNSR